RKWELYEQAVGGGVRIDRADEVEEFVLFDLFRKRMGFMRKPGLFRRDALVADIDLACRVLADEDEDDAGANAFGIEKPRGFRADFLADLRRDPSAVDDPGVRHRRVPRAAPPPLFRVPVPIGSPVLRSRPYRASLRWGVNGRIRGIRTVGSPGPRRSQHRS